MRAVIIGNRMACQRPYNGNAVRWQRGSSALDLREELLCALGAVRRRPGTDAGNAEINLPYAPAQLGGAAEVVTSILKDLDRS
jgi:hypothetical protein